MSKVLRPNRRCGHVLLRPLPRRVASFLAIVIAVAVLGSGAWTLTQNRETAGATGNEESRPASERSADPIETSDSPSPPRRTDTGQSQAPPEQAELSLEADWGAETADLPEPAKQAVLSFIDTAASMQPTPVPTEEEDTVSAPDYSDIAAESALGELTAQFDEFQDNNWAQKGAARLASVQGTEELTLDGKATRRVAICVDSSALELVDQGGQVLLAAVDPGTRTALNYYDLQELEGSWRVVAHSFPDDPIC